MGAKITLTGQAKDIQKLERSVSFYILSGPATQHPPRGLKLFGQTRYHVECTLRQWRRARFDSADSSDLVVEGYLEPRRDPETGQPERIPSFAHEYEDPNQTTVEEQIEAARPPFEPAFTRFPGKPCGCCRPGPGRLRRVCRLD